MWQMIRTYFPYVISFLLFITPSLAAIRYRNYTYKVGHTQGSIDRESSILTYTDSLMRIRHVLIDNEDFESDNPYIRYDRYDTSDVVECECDELPQYYKKIKKIRNIIMMIEFLTLVIYCMLF